MMRFKCRSRSSGNGFSLLNYNYVVFLAEQFYFNFLFACSCFQLDLVCTFIIELIK